jgi:hypothetical protein
MTSLDFSYKTLIILPLISLTNLDLKIRMPSCLTRSYYSKLNTSLPIRLSISYLSDALNGTPEIVILLYFRNSKKKFLIGSFFTCHKWHKEIDFIVFGMTYFILRFFKSFSSSFGRLIYHDYKMFYDRLFFCINRLVSIVVGRFYIFDFFFFLRYFEER